MEKKCQTCRWYNFGKCCNKDFQNSIKTENSFINLTEEGILAEYIRENDDKIYQVANGIIENLYKKDYIKKNKKHIKNYRNLDDYEEYLNEATELIDDIISSFVIPQLENMDAEYQVNKDFCCDFWD